MRGLATIERDGWALESGEARHAAHPDTFKMPSRHDRDNLRVGQAVQLLFQIRTVHEDGSTDVAVERMWATMVGRVGDLYVGILDSQPDGVEPGQGIDRGLEFGFMAEHVIDIVDPPRDWLLRTHGERLRLADKA